MSAQAMGWALDQEIPKGPKLVLVGLSNHADHTTGYCWPSTDTLMREASCSRAAVFVYLAALKRNGYVMSRQTRAATGRGRANDYWILMDREDAPWVNVKRAGDEEKEILSDEPEETTEEQSPDSGLCENAGLSPESGPGIVQDLDSPLYVREPSESKPSEQVESPAEPLPPPGANELRTAKNKIPSSFDRSKRQAEQDRIAAADKARKPQRLFVFEGSDPWKSHVRNGHPPTLKTWGEINGKRCQGWYFPTLYPPKSTGPPSDHLTESDIEELAKG